MMMDKGKSGYTVAPRPHLLEHKGTQLIIAPLLEGNRMLTGEKIHRYLASELRDRIRNSGVKIKVADKITRMEMNVEPRRYEGQLIHNIPPITTPLGDVYMELLFKRKKYGKQHQFVLGPVQGFCLSLVFWMSFRGDPWASGYFEGIIDASFLNLTPGTRDGIIRDEAFAEFCRGLEALKVFLFGLAEEQGKAEDERVSKNILRSVQKAFREAILALPREELRFV